MVMVIVMKINLMKLALAQSGSCGVELSIMVPEVEEEVAKPTPKGSALVPFFSSCVTSV